MNKKQQTRLKQKFIKELEENPIITSVCKKLKVSRATYYRWRTEDHAFRRFADEAQMLGRDKLNDFTESKLLENIKANVHQAIVFWLRHNSKRYRPHAIRVYLDENKRKQSEIDTLQLTLNELIDHIGLDEALRLAGHDPEQYKDKIRKELEQQRKQEDKL